jgi:hypothetical protein
VAGNVDPLMLAELQQETPQVCWGLELYLPGGTERYAFQDVSSETRGLFRGQITQWGDIESGGSVDHQLVLPSLGDTTIEDLDKRFSNRIAIYGAAALRGSRAVATMMSPRVPESAYFTAFDGFLRTWSKAGHGLLTLSFDAKTKALTSKFPKIPLLASDFPNVADRSLYGGHWPRLLYGFHDSRGSTDAGMIPCPFVDKLRNWSLVSLGWTNPVRVHKNKVLRPTSEYTVLHPLIGGRLYTLIQWVAPLATTDVVTADVIGYEDAGDGSGALLTGVNALKHLVVNQLYGDWQGGASLADASAPVSTAHFAAVQSWLVSQGWARVSGRYGGDRQTTGLDAINEFAQGRVFPTFTWDSKLAVAVDDHHATALHHDGAGLVRWDLDLVGAQPFALNWDDSRLFDRVSFSYVYSEEKGGYAQTGEVRDLSAADEAAGSLQLPWSHASYVEA